MTDQPEPLPPYSGPDTHCFKCAHQGCATAYRKANEPRAGDFFAVPFAGRIERLERRCPVCGYQWDEALAAPAGETGR